MQLYEEQLTKLLDSHDIHGACAFIASANGEHLYSHYAGRQLLDPKSSPLSCSTTLTLFSGGKFITHIATLQLIGKGLATLDEPLHHIIPELKNVPTITPNSDPSSNASFELIPPKTPMTLRHMLSNSSGIPYDPHPLIDAWRASGGSYDFPPGTHPIIKKFTVPLLFEPGEGWCYGHDVHFLQVVIERLSGSPFAEYVQKHVFDVLGMKASAYSPKADRTRGTWLQMVERGEGGKLRPDPNDTGYGITCSAADIQALLTDLISPSPRLVGKQMIAELFTSRLRGAGLEAFQKEAFEYAGAPANILKHQTCHLVSYTCGGAMIIEDEGLQSPAGTLVWDGMPNIAWAANRQRGICMFFGTQLLPEYDEKTLGLMKTFFGEAWKNFG